MSGAPQMPSPCAGVVCMRDGLDGPDILLIRRGKPPRLGEWSIPGGRIEWGERAANATDAIHTLAGMRFLPCGEPSTGRRRTSGRVS